MKKVLATIAALGLVLGVSANALALDKPGRVSESEADTAPRVPAPTAPGVALWSVSGQWVLAGAYLNAGLGNAGDAQVVDLSSFGEEEGSDAFYIYSFKILPVLQVNDKISMKGELRFADRDVFGLTDIAKVRFDSDGDAIGDTGGEIMDIYHLYMEWVSPFGKTRFGRTPAGAWAGGFMNSGSKGNRLMWWPNMLPENWGSLLFIQKIAEADAQHTSSDDDYDGYYLDLSYTAPFGKTIVALWNTRSGLVQDAGGDHRMNTQARFYGNYNFTDLNLEYEVNWNFGDDSSLDANGNFKDRKGIGAMLAANYKLQDFTVGGLFFYMSGDDDNSATDTENKAMLSSSGTGNDWNPYQIMTGDYMGLLNTDNPLRAAGSVNGNSIMVPGGGLSSGVWSIGANVKYAMSPKVSISGEIGYFSAIEDLYTDAVDGTSQDDDMGIEFGVGMSYKLMDNLTYSAHFSYLATGDFFKMGESDISTEDIYLLAHALSMKF